MRSVPYGLGWSRLCVLDRWEMVCPCDSGWLFSLCLGLLFAWHGGDIWFRPGSNLFVETMAHNLKTLNSKPFVVIWIPNINSLLPIWLVRLVWLREKIVPFVRWLGRCSTSIGPRRDIGTRRWIPHAMLGIGFFLRLSWTRRATSSCMGEHLEWAILGLLVVGALFSRRLGLISLSRGPPMEFSWVMLVILKHFVCSTLILA
jgi:hypothetical protein